MCRSIITPDSSIAVGFAMPLPTRSGAVPCTASISASPPAPMLPDGVRPRPPMSPAQRSEMMSPYRLGMHMTSNWVGRVTSCMQVLSTIISS